MSSLITIDDSNVVNNSFTSSESMDKAMKTIRICFVQENVLLMYFVFTNNYENDIISFVSWFLTFVNEMMETTFTILYTTFLLMLFSIFTIFFIKY